MRVPSRFAPLFLAVLACLAFTPAGRANWRSSLYPENWQRPAEDVSFTNDQLIQDFSYAGYRRGEAPIPAITGPVFNVVTGYGADPTGAIDSTAAIQSAIDAAATAGGGVVYLPAGEFRVAPQGTNTFALRISTSNIVLRGAGTTSTFLLNTSYTMREKAVVQISPPSTPLGSSRALTADLPGPTRRLPVTSASSFAPGDMVRLQWSFTPEWIAENNQQTWWGVSSPNNSTYLREVVAVNAAEGWIEIDVPTRYALKTRDAATVRTVSGLLSEVGVESLSIGNLQHPGTGFGETDWETSGKAAYDAHNSWLIRFANVRDSWVDSVHSRQAATNTRTCHLLSNGILLDQSTRITVQNCQMRRPQYGGGGGNGYMYRLEGQECLIRNSLAEFSRHGFVTSGGGTSGNVFLQCEDRDTQRAVGTSSTGYTTGGSGSDNHNHFSHSNLWDQCHAHNSFYTAHHRTFSGNIPHGVTSGQAVYWNTSGSGTRYASASSPIVRSEQLHHGYVIGTRATSGTAYHASNPTGGNTAPADILEGIGQGATLSPQSLYLDQLSRRLQPAVIYAANGATSGVAPADAASPYSPGNYVTVLGAGGLARAGFAFTGWNTAPDGSGAAHAPGDSFAITGTTHLYARWEELIYTVAFDARGGTAPAPASKELDWGATYGTLATTTRAGHTFLGWFTAPTGGALVTSTSPLAVNADHTLYARWNAHPQVATGPAKTITIQAVAPWTPTQISTAAWYDAADASTLTVSGGTVAQWADKSGNQNHAAQATASARPATGVATIGGLNALQFTATSGTSLVAAHSASLNPNTGGGYGLYVVYNRGAQVNQGSGNNVVFNKGGLVANTAPEYGLWYFTSLGDGFDDRLKLTPDGFITVNKSALHESSVVSSTYTHANFNVSVWKEGNLQGTDSSAGAYTASTEPLRFGGDSATNRHANAVIGEFLLVPGLQTAELRQQLEGYLAHKWSLAAQLPADHPHKTSAPALWSATGTLSATVTDLENDSLTYAWSVVSGPGSVTFADATAAQTSVTFTEAGVYVLRLTSGDGLGSSFADLTVTVSTSTTHAVHLDAQGGAATTPAEILATINQPYGALPTPTRAGFTFTGWFTAAAGGSLVTPATVVTLAESHTLFARWNALPAQNLGSAQAIGLDVFIPWTPEEIATAAWYDAADASTLTTTSGTVSAWADKSGNANHVSQATGSLRPATGVATIGGLNTVSFTATNSVGHRLSAPHHASLALDASDGVNVFSVFNYTGFVSHAGGAVNSILTKGDPFDATVAYGIRVNSNNALRFKSGANTQLLLNATQLGNDLLYTGASHSTDPLTYANFHGTRVTQTAAKGASNNTSPLDLGGKSGSSTLFAGFKLGELILAGGPLSEATVQTIEGYLAHKWSLAANLPAAHPYKTTAPGDFIAVSLLDATVTDPEGDSITHTWSVVSGPGSALFGDDSALATTATFTQTGTYTLRLTSGDGFGTTTTDVVVTVWADLTPTVTLDAQGGATPVPATLDVTYGSAYGALPTTTRVGYSFTGWFTAPTGGSQVTPATVVTVGQAHTLYARWNAHPVVDAGPAQYILLDVLVPWTPEEIATAAWFDAADAATLTASGGAISQWSDKSGHANHATQATATVRPTTGTTTLGGLPAVSFRIGDGTTKQFLSAPNHATLNLDATGGANVFAVLKYLGWSDQGSTTNAALSKGEQLSTSVAYGIPLNSSSALSYKAGSSTSVSAGNRTNQTLLFSGTRNDATLTASVHAQGTLAASTTKTSAILSENTSPLYLGRDTSGGRYANVDFGEILILGGALSTAQRQQIEGYLAHKWSLAASLPADHPHKTIAPGPFIAVADLAGLATDPEDDNLTHAWSVISGPAPVTFADDSALDTTATFTEAGAYTLRLTSEDGPGSTSADLTITVSPTP